MYKNIDELTPHPASHRIYGDEILSDDFLNSIKEHGILVSLTITPDNKVISGNRRLQAAIELGLDQAPVQVAQYESDLDELAAIIDFNRQRDKTFSQRMREAESINEIERARAKARMLATQNNNAGRAATATLPEQPKGETREKVSKKIGMKPRTYDKAKKIWAWAKGGDKSAKTAVNNIDNGEATISGAYNKIKKKKEIAEAKEKIIHETALLIKHAPEVYHETAALFSNRIEPHTADLLLTDPPYSTDIDNLAEFANSWLPEYLGKVKPTGRAYVFIGAYPVELATYLSIKTPDHISLSQVLVWTYKNTLGQNPKDRYKLNWQAILYYVGKDVPDLNAPMTSEQWAVQDINAPDGRQGDRHHKWQKPIEIAERFIRHSTSKGDTVIDPFVCTGTFLLAAAKLGRIGIGCDSSMENLQIAKDRGCTISGQKI